MAIVVRNGRTRTTLSEINMVPFIDIVLVLLIIFMITAPVIQSGVEVSLPRTKFVRRISEPRQVVSIDRKERLYLNDEPVNISQLVPKILERGSGAASQSVYLRADEKVSWGTITKVMDRLKLGGIENISAVTQPEASQKQ